MPISMQRFASEGHLVRFDFTARQPSERSATVRIQCRVCNYEPPLDRPLMKVCPKCHASVWEWFAQRDHVEPSERAGHRFATRGRACRRGASFS